MKIELKHIKIADLINGYQDNDEAGVVGFGGKLNIRPAYQREFVYKENQRDAVIHTLRQNFPLNIMYWAKVGNHYELMDGQQRTVSICRYVNNQFSIDMLSTADNKIYPKSFHNLKHEQQQQILDYELSVYVCEGTEQEKLDWFKIINIAGEKLTNQELRNAIYTGSWLSDAKKYFSKTGCAASQMGDKYLNGSPIRQDYLETVIAWISNNHIEQYMSEHQHNKDAQDLWQYFQAVIAWVQRLFPNTHKLMKGLDWGLYFNQYKNNTYNANDLAQKVTELIDDDEVTSKKGIYEYLLSGNPKFLSLRLFDEKTKLKVYQQQKGICPLCNKHYTIQEMEADHIVAWHEGGKTTIQNCQMLCKLDNRTKSGK